MLPVSRRQLLGFLAGFLVPDLRAGSIHSVDHSSEFDIAKSSTPQPTATSFLVPDSTDPSALEAWKRLPMLPLIDFKDFSSVATTDKELFLGRMILGHIGSQTAFEFRYLGGSQPGTDRRVHPILLFRKSELIYDVPDLPVIYLLAFCHTRQQARTFRIDRISTL